MTRRKALGAASALLSFSASSAAWGTSVVAVRLWPSPLYTRLTIETDVRLTAKHTYYDQPPRLVIELDDVSISGPLAEIGHKVLADDPNIAQVYVLPSGQQKAQLSIELKRPVSPQIFSLGPVATYAHRLVIDLYGAPMADPLGDLINNQLSKKSLLTPNPARAEVQSPVTSTPSGTTAGRGKKSKTKPLRPIMVAIDPGHGGEDPGATGPGGTREKEVVLSIAKKLHERIRQAHFPGMVIKSYLTRDGDYFVPLNLRVEKAIGVNADLLVSIHADAFSSAAIRGASVFALSQRGASSAAAKWMADKENSADLVGGIDLKSRDTTIQRVMLDMSTSAQIRDSMKVGTALLKQVGNIAKLHRGYVEQAGFAVLKAPDIPSVLVETAFISNPEEEALLRSNAYQDQLAEALLQGIAQYFASYPPKARPKTKST